ncbi:MAG: enoyl-CoA hydratase-related protein [Beutenbergiaceae bacterium]
MSRNIDYRVDDGVAMVHLNAPERRNALDPEMADELTAICAEIASDRTVGATAIFGRGKSFCAGAVRAVLERAGQDPADGDRWDELGRIYAAFTAFGELPVPTIAGVAGAAVGAGMNLALAADVRIVTDDALFLSGFLDIGIHPGGGHLHLLERSIGRSRAAAIGLLGAPVPGAQAVDAGLAWACVASDEIESAVLSLAAKAAADPALSRHNVASFRATVDGVPWASARAVERSAQMWSLRRRAQKEWS